MMWKWTSTTKCGGCGRNQVHQHSKTIISLPANLLPQLQEVDVTDLLQHYFSGEECMTQTCSRSLEGGMPCTEVAARVNKLMEQGEVLMVEIQQANGYKVTSKRKMTLNGRPYHLQGVAYHHQLEANSGHFSAIVFRCGGYWRVDGLFTTIATAVDSWTNAVQMISEHTHDRFRPISNTIHTSVVVYKQGEVG